MQTIMNRFSHELGKTSAVLPYLVTDSQSVEFFTVLFFTKSGPGLVRFEYANCTKFGSDWILKIGAVF